MKSKFLVFLLVLGLLSFCNEQNSENNVIRPDIITEQVPYDSEDPAIWINKDDPSKSIIFGTDKNTSGAIYAFGLDGKIIHEKTIKGLKRPNNIDIAYNVKLSDDLKSDILVVTERERTQLRIFAIPSMAPVDGGELPVFEGEPDDYAQPMGVAFYTSPIDNSVYIIVSRKKGPVSNYLFQYKVVPGDTNLSLQLVRKFGNFSDKQEIEAIAVDNELGYIYYADEDHCIRKYYAEPGKGNKEVGCFGQGVFKHDIEGLALVKFDGDEGYLLASNQQNGSFSVFSRKENEYLKELYLGTKDTDGCDAVNMYLNEVFNTGIFVAMNNSRNYYFYELSKLGLPDTDQ